MSKNFKDYSEDIYKCTKCGLCQSVCPVYAATGLETTVSRGKFTMLNGIINGQLKFNKKIAKNLELCLGCKACYDFCPSGISAEEIIIAARHESNKINKIGFIKKFILDNFKSNFRLSLLKLGLDIYRFLFCHSEGHQRHIVKSSIHEFGIYKSGLAAPKNLSNSENCQLDRFFASLRMTNYLTLFNAQLKENTKYKKLKPVKNLSKLKIVYFPGCINNYVNSSVKNAVLIVLEKNGFIANVSKNFSCCGIAARNAGDYENFRQLAENNINQIPDNTDYIITDCASCGSVWEFYPEFVSYNLKEKAQILAKKTVNINKFLAEQRYLYT